VAGRRTLALVLVVALAVVGGVLLFTARQGQGTPDSTRPLGLFTTLPILWPETGEVGDLLHGDAPSHWALAVLRRHGTLVPLDVLAGAGGKLPLAADGVLVMAQPRPLAPAENVALDDWVSAGGHLLLLADPLLTAHSAYGLGDRRRPQDTVLLSPILSRWGLRLAFDEQQPDGQREVSVLGAAVPVRLAGHFTLVPGTGKCMILAQGLVARCKIGRGEVLALADAALLEDGDGTEIDARAEALATLVGELAD
jgi:hypothetical protein